MHANKAPLPRMQPRLEASQLQLNWGLFALSIEARVQFFRKILLGRCKRQLRQGLVTRKPITQVSRAGCIHPPTSLHPPLCLGAAALLLQEALASGELHLPLLVPQEVRRYRSRLMQRVEYSVVIAGTDHEFPSDASPAWSPIASLSHPNSIIDFPREETKHYPKVLFGYVCLLTVTRGRRWEDTGC